MLCSRSQRDPAHISPGQARQARTTGDRRPVRKETQGRRGRAKDVRLTCFCRTAPKRPPSAQSNLTNKSRLKLLHRREEQVQELFEAARLQIVTFAEDEARYTQFLEGAIVQGLLQLMEPDVTLIVRGKDVERAQKAGEAAAETYTQLSGRHVSIGVEGSLSNDRYVSVSC